MTTTKIEADESACIGAGNCVGVAPTLFGQDSKTGVVVVLKSHAEPGEREEALLAADVCPVAAIALAGQ